MPGLIPYIQYTDKMVGAGHPTLADTLNAQIRAILTHSGLDPDASFAGFAALNDGLMLVTDAADRNTKIPSPAPDRRVYNKATQSIERYDAPTATWVADIHPGAKGDKGDPGIQGPAGSGVTLVSTLVDRDNLLPSTASRIIVKETGEAYRWNGTTYVLEQERPQQVVNAKAKGALGDGTGMTIASYNASIGQAASYRRSDWVGVYADTDTMDYAGLQEAYYAAFGNPGAEHSSSNSRLNFALYIPGGQYLLSQALRWNRTLSPYIWGDGRQTTRIIPVVANRPAVRTNGFTFGQVFGIGFYASADNPEDEMWTSVGARGALFELDWDMQWGATSGLADTPVASATQTALAPSDVVAWTANAHAGRYLWLVAGTGSTGARYTGTMRRIKGNTATRLDIDDVWDTLSSRSPDATTKFVIADLPVARRDGLAGSSRGQVSGSTLSTGTTLEKNMSPSSWQLQGAYDVDGYDSKHWVVGAHVNRWAVIIGGTGAGQYRQITANTDRQLTVSPAWAVIPDGTSTYAIMQNAPVGVDSNTPFTVSAASVTNATLTITGTPTWTANQFLNQEVWIVSGTGKGQVQVCSGNNTTGTLTVEQPWDILPDATSVVRVIARVAWGATLQGNHFHNCEWSAEGYNVGYLLRCPRHGNLAQGSENMWFNCFWNWARKASFCSNGANALQNSFWGGNMQSYNCHGIWVVSGAAYANGVGFQSNYTAQLANGGYEMLIVNSADDHSSLENCRIEGFRMASCGNSHQLTVRSTYNVLGGGGWGANTIYSVGNFVHPTSAKPVAQQGLFFQVTHVTGDAKSGATEPNWLSDGLGGSITDGNVTWSQVNLISLQGENLRAQDVGVQWGQIDLRDETRTGSILDNVTVSRADWLIGSAAAESLSRFSGVTVHLGGGVNDAGVSTPYAINGSTRTFKSVDAHGNGEAVVFIGGDGTGYAAPVGMRRGDWNTPVLATFGIIGRDSPTTHDLGLGAKPAYIADTKGEDMILAGGISTGAATTANPNDTSGNGGDIRLQISKPGAAGATANPLVDAVEIDHVTGQLKTLFGTRVKVTTATVASGGTDTFDASQQRVRRITANGNITVANPSNTPVDGDQLVLDILNNTAGAITVTLGAAFLGTFPAGAAGKRRTQQYFYDGTASKWVPIGGQSGDL